MIAGLYKPAVFREPEVPEIGQAGDGPLDVFAEAGFIAAIVNDDYVVQARDMGSTRPDATFQAGPTVKGRYYDGNFSWVHHLLRTIWETL